MKEIIRKSSFKVQEGKFAYAKVTEAPNVNEHFMVSTDEDEITVVTREENLKKLDLIERNKETYKLISLNVSVPFYAVGFLAAVSNAVASAGMNILIISTYSKDYILVKKSIIETVRDVLIELGLNQK